MPKKGDLSGFSAAQLKKALDEAIQNEAKKKQPKLSKEVQTQHHTNLLMKSFLKS